MKDIQIIINNILGETCQKSSTDERDDAIRNQLVTQATTTLPSNQNAIISVENGIANTSGEALGGDGNTNNNCTQPDGCQLQSLSTTTTTTTRPFSISFSISPLFGNFHRPTQTEATLGTERVSDDFESLDETEELPSPGLGENFINEVYRLDNNETSLKPGKIQSNKEASPDAVITEQTNGKEDSKEDIKDVVNALRGLIQLLNSTDKGRKKLQSLKSKLYLKSKPSSPKNPIEVKNIVIGDQTPNVQSFLNQPYTNLLINKAHVGQYSYSTNQEAKEPIVNKLELKVKQHIPPHLIPLGPDGNPLINPDGSLYDQPNFSVGQNTQMFSYLNYIEKTTISPEFTSKSLIVTDVASLEHPDSEDKDMITTMIDSVRDLPMDTKRHMLANMMFMVPMAALTMAAAGVPHLAIAPLATLIPGFLFAAFTETNPAPRTEDQQVAIHGHGHGSMVGSSQGGHPTRTGISGLISGLREFYSHRRENQTLQITTGNLFHHG